MENPYETPKPARARAQDTAHGGLPIHAERGWVGHVRIVSGLMILQGALELAMAAFFIVVGVVYPGLMQTVYQGGDSAGGGGGQATAFMVLGGVMVIMGLLVIAVAILRIYAGVRCYGFRGRTLGIVALGIGTAASITFYCAPTALILAIYGLIVLLSAPVDAAFRYGQQGHSANEILASFPKD